MNEPVPLEPIHASAYVFVGVTLLGGAMVFFLRNILHAIFGLALTILGLAGLFLYLGSPFVAAMQILIYIGGISVAMVFAVMFSYSLGVQAASVRARTIALLPVAIFFAGMLTVIRGASFEAPASAGDGSLEAVGRALLTHYNLVFEALSVVLLLAIIGAIIIARRDPEP